MPSKLPIEILDLIVQYSTTGTLVHLSAISRDAYFASVRILYASIPEMSIARTTKCLRTLSKKPELARLANSFSYQLPSSPHFLQAFLTLLSLALSNMSNLRILSLDVEAPITVSLPGHISFKLTKLVLSIPPGLSYPVSQFLSSQPSIEELVLVCRSEDLSTLGTEALPLLKDLSAPLWVLPQLLTSRLSHISRLSVIGVMKDPESLVALGLMLELSNPPESLVLLVSARVSTHRMTTAALSQGLRFLGQAAPFISLLVLTKYGNLVKQDELQNMFTLALPSFPNLKSLILIPHSPAPNAYTSDPQTRPVQAPSGVLSLFYSALAYLYTVFVNTPRNFLSLLSSRFSVPQAESNQAHHQPSPTLDAFHDPSCHLQIVKAWGKIHPRLEHVVFPNGAYKLVQVETP